MIAADLALRWMHILGAIVLVGGSFFIWFAYLPAVAGETGAAETAQVVRRRWSRLVMAASGLLLLSGLINFVRIVQRYEIDDTAFPGSLYHMLFGIKFLLALAVFFLSAALSGRSRLAERLRGKERMWHGVNLTLAVLIVLIAGVMKMSGRREKSAPVLRPSEPHVAQAPLELQRGNFLGSGHNHG